MLSYQTFVTFPSWSYLLTPCCFINFSRLIKPLSSYQTFVIFSSFVIYSHFTLSTHPLNAPAVRTTNKTPTLILSCARSLRQYTFLTQHPSLVIVPFWYWGSRRGCGFSLRTSGTLQIHEDVENIRYTIRDKSIKLRLSQWSRVIVGLTVYRVWENREKIQPKWRTLFASCYKWTRAALCKGCLYSNDELIILKEHANNYQTGPSHTGNFTIGTTRFHFHSKKINNDPFGRFESCSDSSLR